MRLFQFVLLSLWFAPIAFANELPDMPTPKVKIAVSPTAKQPRFWDAHAKVAAASTIGLLAWDSANTCNNLAHGGHEDWLHTQSCGVAVAEMTASKIAFWGAAYLFHRHHHDKIARVFEWAGPAWSAAGVAYSYYVGSASTPHLTCIHLPTRYNCHL